MAGKKNLSDAVSRTDNPLLDDFSELVTLDSRDCADTIVAESVKTLDKLGKEQYQKYVKDVIKDRTRSIHNPIVKNNLPLFSKNHKKEVSKPGKKIAVLQSNLNLFVQLYITLQSRDGVMREIFSHEVQCFPTALSELGNLRVPSAKSDLKMSAAK